jgi:hypothetical protein
MARNRAKQATSDWTNVLPADVQIPAAHFQKGWNRFTTKWIVALADLRASADNYWDKDHRDDADCYHCKLPKLMGHSPSTVNFSRP